MLMVIFGAGASFDSCPTYRPFQRGPDGAPLFGPEVEGCRPPLAKDVFDNREMFVDTLEDFYQCKTIVGRLRHPAVLSGAVSIEKCLGVIREEAKTYPRGAQELAAVRCYLQRAIWRCEERWRYVTKGITNQLALLREIERNSAPDESVCLVTFNYDRLLEDALGLLGSRHAVDRMEDYASRDRLFRLFKVHGSVNWGLEFDGGPNFWPGEPFRGSYDSLIVERTPPIHTPHIYVRSDPLTLCSVDGRFVFPAIAIPVEDKNEFQFPDSVFVALKELLPKVSRVVTIGWRASEAHFLGLLDGHLRPGVRTFVVAGGRKDAEEVRTRILRGMPSSPPNCTAEDVYGFTDFVLSGLAGQIVSDCLA